MPTNQLTGSQIATFKGIELHKYLSVISDTRGPRVVVHEFPFRDGAKIEALGRKPHRTDWTLTFTGPKWLSDFRKLSDSIDAAPGGMLVHPIYGQMTVVCNGFDRATVNVVEATDTIVVPLSFVEDQTDLGLDQASTVSSVSQTASASVASFIASAAVYADAASQASVALFGQMATTFIAAATQSSDSVTVDASLPGQISALLAQMTITQGVLQTSLLAAQSVAQVADVLSAAEVVGAQCIALSDQVSLTSVVFGVTVVQGRTSITVLAQRLYGNLAINYIDQLLALNPNLVDPTNIPAGTTVLYQILTAAA